MPKTASQCLQLAERVEVLAQQLYTDLAEAFAAEAELSRLFRRLAAEEEQHGMRIRLLGRHAGRAPWPPDLAERSCADLEAMAVETETLRTNISNLPSPPDAGRVLELLVSMEDRFHSVHAQELARCAVPEVARLFASLAAQDAAHHALLRAALTATAA
ncbi:MAG TPA: ferritin family protein [Anaeromyxobacteraceae bacterium]|nr:ferritin family protein [Anaeromyxobacteraceae bacterium]